MKETIEKLKTMLADTNYDLTCDWINDDQEMKRRYERQSTQMASAIGILENLGDNNNF